MIFRLFNPHFSPGRWASAVEVFVFSTLQRCFGSLQGTDCAGRIRAYLRSSTRDDCCRRRNGTSNSSKVYRRPVGSITVLFMSVLYKFCCGLTCYEHPLQSTTIPHIIGGWML